MGVIVNKDWPAANQRELTETVPLTFRTTTPTVFGTASALLQCLRSPGIERWVSELTRGAGIKRVVIHFHNGWQSGVFLPLRLAQSLQSVTVATAHGVNPILGKQPVRLALHRWMANRLVRDGARMTSVSAANTLCLGELLRIAPEEFHVIPNGMSDTEKRGCPFATGDASFTVGYVGLMQENKGWRVAAQAVERLLKQGETRVRLVMAGSGPDAERATEFARRNEAHVEYLGYVPDARDSVMPRLDLLTLMSEFEGFPMTLVEAMSLGVPSAATAVGDVAEALGDKAGFLLKRDPAVLADVILGLLNDREKLARYGRMARERFEDKFRVDRIVGMYDELYQSELAK
jgi:glycosyltransferase involved in cell wall biosynthesis